MNSPLETPQQPSETTSTEPQPHDGSNLALLENENTRLRSIIRDAAAHRQMTGELRRAGARDAELMFAAVRADLQFADNDTVANAAAVIEQLRFAYPGQFGPERPAPIDATAGMASQPRLSKQSLAKMTPAEIAKLDWDSVREILAR